MEKDNSRVLTLYDAYSFNNFNSLLDLFGLAGKVVKAEKRNELFVMVFSEGNVSNSLNKEYELTKAGIIKLNYGLDEIGRINFVLGWKAGDIVRAYEDKFGKGLVAAHPSLYERVKADAIAFPTEKRDFHIAAALREFGGVPIIRQQ